VAVAKVGSQLTRYHFEQKFVLILQQRN